MPNSTKKSDTSESKTPTRTTVNSSCSSVNSTPGSSNRRPLRKRRRVERGNEQLDEDKGQTLNSQLGDCNIEDAKEIDRRLRKVARENAISREDMHKVVRSVVRNDHVLALVTLKAEDELAREKREAAAKEEQQRGAIIITETPSVAKLTRAKARELNKTPGITFPPLNDTSVHNEIEALIRDDLHSDEDDEEYTFKEDDFHSDEDHNTTASDFDSNPCTPQTPQTANEESPIKFTSDGCFKLPLEKGTTEDPRIATRTRSKLCLQQTTIEDLQSEFVPPDVEEQSELLDYDMTANDADWMQFLNDFSKPLNNSFLCDDDDPINDPEYVAEMVPVDAEELRDVNIPKKELTDLVSELFAGLLQEGVSLESIELETPHKFLVEHDTTPIVQPPADPLEQVSRQIDFDVQSSLVTPETVLAEEAETADISITTHSETFLPNVVSTPGTMCNFVPVPLAELTGSCSQLDPACPIVSISTEVLGQQPPELIAVPLLGQPNCFQLAKVTANTPLLPQQANSVYTTPTKLISEPQSASQSLITPYTEPYDTNFSWKYLSISKHFHSEYQDQFEGLRYLTPTPASPPSNVMGFTQEQHDLLQQQLRIHTQILTQTFLQTYSHPLLYAMAEKPKQMLQELHQRAAKHASFNCWNLNGAVQLINKWEQDLSSDQYQEENEKMMRFINKEVELTDGHTRQVARLAPRIMDLMLDSTVFMYPQYLPRMAFQPKTLKFTSYAPSEYQLIAMGLEKHLNAIKSSKKPLRKGMDPVRSACRRMVKDCVHGKEFRRIFLKVKQLCDTEQYNPVKYYFAHNRAPPIEHILLGFENGVVRTAREQYHALPSGWKYYIENNWNNEKRARRTGKPIPVEASVDAGASYLDFVREAVGEYILLPNSVGEPSEPHGSVTCLAQTPRQYTKSTGPPNKTESKSKEQRKSRHNTSDQNLSSSLTINVNYVFGGEVGDNKRGAGVSVPFNATNYENTVANINRTLQPSSECSLLALPPPIPPLAEDDLPAINLCFDELTQTVQIKELDQSVERTGQTHSLPTTGSKKKARFRIFKRQTVIRQQGSRKFSQTAASTSKSPQRHRYHVLRQRLRHKLQNRCQSFISSYTSYLQQRRDLYAHAESVQYYFRRFLALELYTQLLTDLKMFCESKSEVQAKVSSPQQQKRQRCEEAARNRKANRHEEMLRHMLQADSPEERNRKDATFAFNFYEKVEEALLSSNRLEDCHRFNHLLQTFDPKQDKVSELYLKVEKLLLPDFPELAEVFLNFLLPAEAAELGKFFEYFMITNASSFINKLNIYFGKQPAQIRKIYACLNELAELPSASMKKVESKILPLLKGNQFLCDWFVQQFPQAKPPKRVLPPAETINMHEVLNNTSGSFLETINELPNDPPAQGKPPGCQLRYLNGRIFYGSKVMLPAKLSFRAASIYNEQNHDALSGENFTCAHGVRAQGEKLINTAAADSDDAADRSEEDDASRALVIDTTTGDEENSSSSIDMCDDVALRAHAMRLNANYYNSFNNAFSSTPSVGSGNHHSHHHPHAKKTAINFGETSPRRQTSLNVSPLSGVSPLPALASNTSGNSPQMDKRKSPSKKVRSPLGQTQTRPRYNVQPMVVIHEPPVRALPAHSPAIECAKRLRTLINQESSLPDELDIKANIRIIAQAKQPIISPPVESHNDQKVVSMETAEVSNQSATVIEMDIEPPVEEPSVPRSTPQNEIVTQYDSDEDCKLDVVASLANSTPSKDSTEAKVVTESASAAASAAVVPSSSSAWTREEDKVMLIEMKIGARDRQLLIKRMCAKLKHRNEGELHARHQFLIDFLSKLQGK